MLTGRAKKLCDCLPQDFEAALIGTPENRFYLLDFDAGDAGHLLLFPGKMLYIIDSRYIEEASRKVTNAQVVLEEDALAQISGLLADEKVKKIYLEEKMPIASWSRLKEKIPNVEYDISATLSKQLSLLRQVKDGEELRRMKAAQQVTDSCFTHILPFIKEGVREIELALEMEHFMRSHGAQQIAFDTIAVAGANSSLPHGVPGDNRLKAGDLLTLDFGAKVDGYCSDMTRTVALGKPGEPQRKVYSTVLKAHLEAMAAARGGLRGSEVDAVARRIIDEAGYKSCFGHGLGHSVGIEIHEDPRFSPRCHDVVPVGSVMTIEPGIYLAGQFGCRIEDMVLMEEGGCTSFATSQKELLVL